MLFRKLSQKRGCLPFKRRTEDWQFGWLQVLPGVAEIRKQNSDIDDIIQFDEDTVIEVNFGENKNKLCRKLVRVGIFRSKL